MNAPLADVRLEDKYIFSSGRFYLSATQALVRLLIMQRLRDQALYNGAMQILDAGNRHGFDIRDGCA
jgi:hypothetical protein